MVPIYLPQNNILSLPKEKVYALHQMGSLRGQIAIRLKLASGKSHQFLAMFHSVSNYVYKIGNAEPFISTQRVT